MDIIDIQFDEKDGTRERLIKATQALVAVYGYDATTTRMIASTAGVSLSAINFHFGSKEDLAREAIVDLSENLEHYYSKLACEIRHFLKQQPVDKDKAWGYLDRLISDRLRRALDYRASWVNIGVAEHENGLPESSRGLLAKQAIKTSEAVFAELILAVSDRRDVFQAAQIARAINASIMSYCEKPLMRQYMGEFFDVDMDDIDRTEECLHDYFMRSIEAAVVVDPRRAK